MSPIPNHLLQFLPIPQLNGFSFFNGLRHEVPIGHYNSYVFVIQAFSDVRLLYGGIADIVKVAFALYGVCNVILFRQNVYAVTATALCNFYIEKTVLLRISAQNRSNWCPFISSTLIVIIYIY